MRRRLCASTGTEGRWAVKLKRNLTVEEHEQIAASLRRINDELLAIWRKVSSTYGVSDRAAKILEKMVMGFGDKRLGSFKSLMDEKFYREGHGYNPKTYPSYHHSPYYGHDNSASTGTEGVKT